MKIILGLGNPGREYALTRHNVAWWLVDYLYAQWAFDGWKRDGEAVVATGTVGTVRTRLIKPHTYMNLSGAVLRPILRRPTWSPQTDLLVIADDVALPVGHFRIRGAGSAGGHNGLKSVEGALQSRAYARLRIGVGPNDEQRQISNMVDFVLGAVGKDERQTILDLLPLMADATEAWISGGVEVAMNKFNRRASSC
jgi:PTH1 family peptidyl-tRNA hydrolase